MEPLRSESRNDPSMSVPADIVDHIGHWLEYLAELHVINADDKGAKAKHERQIRCLLEFLAGTNCNISHNELLQHYYTDESERRGDGILASDEKRTREESTKSKKFIEEFRHRLGASPMAVHVTEPIQRVYPPDDPAFQLIRKALASENLYFLQGPPGTGKTTAIVEIILQQVKAKRNARILVSSETHVAVDNALDRLAKEASPELLDSILRYSDFRIEEFECPSASQTSAIARAKFLWNRALEFDQELTEQHLFDLHPFDGENGGFPRIKPWQAKNLAEMHQVIGVTCNQINHLMDGESQFFDLAIVDECSKATMPEWLMAMGVARKCILVGDHKQLPPTFCEDETEVLAKMDEYKERLIRNGVIERLFENLPLHMKGTLVKQYRMLPEIGEFISRHFYDGMLEHHRSEPDYEFQDFGWLTYKSNGYRVPASGRKHAKSLVNKLEVRIIMERLADIDSQLKQAGIKKSVSVAVITPYRAQCKALKKALEEQDFSEAISVEVNTVDAFQGRQASIVFFSFVRNTGSARFYADDRRLNVAISRSRDALYLVGDVDYIRSKCKRYPVLSALLKRPILEESRAEQRAEVIGNLSEGQTVDGVIKNITEYGAFVDLDGVDGLLRVTDMAWGWRNVNHPSEIVTIGETTKVQIIKINKETHRIDLGMKQLQDDPWDQVGAKYPLGSGHKGAVTNITDYGAFVELEGGVEGLVHVSEMPWTKKNVHPGEIVSVSQEVNVIVLEVDVAKRRMSLRLESREKVA